MCINDMDGCPVRAGDHGADGDGDEIGDAPQHGSGKRRCRLLIRSREIQECRVPAMSLPNTFRMSLHTLKVLPVARELMTDELQCFLYQSVEVFFMESDALPSVPHPGENAD